MIRGKRRWLGLLLALTVIRGLIYVVLIPPWQAPDENGHFEYAWLIAHLRRLPTREDVSPAFEQELLASLYEWRYGEFIDRPLPEGMPARMDDLPMQVFARRSRTIRNERFSLSYLWQALFLLPIRFQDLPFQLFIARFSSVLLNVGIVWLAFRTFSELVLSRSYLICAMTAVVVFLPQHTFINGSVGDGPLAELMACLVLFCWVLIFRRGVRAWTFVGIVLGTVGGLWSKTTVSFLIPLNVGLALWWLLRQPRQNWTSRYLAYIGVSAVVLGIAVWAWNQFQSPLGSRTLSGLWESLFVSDGIWVDRRGITFGEAVLLSHNSFWANFGWMAVPLSSRWYVAVLLLMVAAALGWVLRGRDQADFPPWALTMMVVSLLTALFIFGWKALLAPSSGYYQFQGRYLFPAIIPFAFLLAGGWAQIAPSRRRGILIWSGVMFLALFDAWSIMYYVVPYFYFR